MYLYHHHFDLTIDPVILTDDWILRFSWILILSSPPPSSSLVFFLSLVLSQVRPPSVS